MLFNLVHVLSSNEELHLSPALLPQEHAFLSRPEHLQRAVSRGDVHLVGELCHCMDAFSPPPCSSLSLTPPSPAPLVEAVVAVAAVWTPGWPT